MSILEHAFKVARKKWGGNGSGSSPQRTAKLATELSQLVDDLGIKTILDIGCGELTWLEPVAARVDHYYGVEVVRDVVEANRVAFAGRENMTFTPFEWDMDLPAADLVICRDVFAHLANKNTLRLIEMIKESGSNYLLATTCRSAANRDTPDGGFRPVNLEKIPFKFPEPSRAIEEGFEQKTMALWKIKRLP